MNADQKNLYAGEKLIGRYGCYGCHNVPGFENCPTDRHGADGSGKQTHLAARLRIPGDRALDEPIGTSAKLNNPRVFDEGRVKRPEELLKMPNFGLSDKEVQSIVMVLTSLVKDPVPLEMKDRTTHGRHRRTATGR